MTASRSRFVLLVGKGWRMTSLNLLGDPKMAQMLVRQSAARFVGKRPVQLPPWRWTRCFAEGKPVAHVNLDALIRREDFEFETEKDDAPVPLTITVRDLEHQAFFYQALRKPDFQRETGEWEPNRVVGLIRTFVNGDLIPAVILWRHRELLFVIDGSHRLSALVAWVQDDYGDGDLSRKFFMDAIPEEQRKAAQIARRAVERDIGSYKSHVQAVENPSNFGQDIVQRARSLGSLVLSLQWVRGSTQTAEKSFIRINQQAAMITPQELELIEKRKKPNAISARAIIRRGTGQILEQVLRRSPNGNRATRPGIKSPDFFAAARVSREDRASPCWRTGVCRASNSDGL
jgi:hypothetical protein